MPLFFDAIVEKNNVSTKLKMISFFLNPAKQMMPNSLRQDISLSS